MTNSIFIGKALYLLLNDDAILKKSVTGVYPLIAENDAKYPFITYSRDNIYSNICKDGYYEDKVTFSVTVVSANYLNSLDIANRVRAILEQKEIITKDVILYNVKLTGIDESFNDNAYIQNLSFDCTVTN